MFRTELEAAVQARIITAEQATRLIAFLESRTAPAAVTPVTGPAVAPSKFDFVHVLWYAGALIVIGALGLFTTVAFAAMGPSALTFTALAYGTGFIALGRYLWGRPGLRTPAGLLITCAVNMVPMAVYGIQAQFDLWPIPMQDPMGYDDFFSWLNASWVYMDIATIVAGAIALRFYPFPFIAAIMAGALWFLSMDLVPWIALGLQGSTDFSWELREKVSMYFGLAVILVAWALDLKRWQAGDFAFWVHLAGVICFWGGLTSQNSDSEFLKLVYFLINIGMVVLAVFLGRRIYAVFGALGVSFYLGYLAYEVFEDSLLFPLFLSMTGLAVIGLGIWYFKKQKAIAHWLLTSLPPELQRLRPVHARMAGA
ncbi:hypothetical protein [Dongia sp.]|uniref:hypothetical protein n=1 Tax=Dongia sp. TaxID=1977262 RepID=UPI0037525EC8